MIKVSVIRREQNQGNIKASMLLVSPGAIDNKSIGSNFSQRSRMARQSISCRLI